MATWRATTPLQASGFCRGTISGVCDEDGTVQLTISDPFDRKVTASIAVVGPWTPQIGEEVLVAEGDECYVIGVLRRQEQAPARVCDRRGELLFEYDPATDTARLRMGAASLVVESEEGDIEFRSSGEIRMDCEALQVRSGRAASSDASLELRPSGMRYRGDSLELEAQNGAVRVEDLSVEGEILELRHGRVQLLARSVRSLVDSLVERAKNVYRRVEETHELRAGRARVCIDDLYQVRADKASIGAKRDVKINAEKIHLG